MNQIEARNLQKEIMTDVGNLMTAISKYYHTDHPVSDMSEITKCITAYSTKLEQLTSLVKD